MKIKTNHVNSDFQARRFKPLHLEGFNNFLLCNSMGLLAVSDLMHLVDDLEIELLNENDKGAANADYETLFPTGIIKTNKLDGSGKAKIEDLDPGEVG